MKRIVLLLFVLTLWSCNKSSSTVKGDWYGEQFDLNNENTSLSQTASLDVISDQETRVFEGIIKETCSVKGCWMTIQNSDSAVIRVKFKDYSFFVPTSGAEGKLASFEGVLTKREVSKAEATHYAEDEGHSLEKAEQMASNHIEYNIEATGVFIQE